MAKVVDAVEIRPRVFYRTIQIGPVFFEEPPADDDVVEIPGDGLRLNSSDNDFYPLVRLEVWDGPASRPSEDWDYERDFRASSSGHVSVVDLGGVAYGMIQVPSGTYVLRLLCRGREHLVATLALDPFPPEGPHEDPLEFWLLQMWPAG
ncbi:MULTISPECIES: hypothetical protein [Streptomyces]|uniref:Uncharacterized protein n=1 Tax=Streptomyces edwardsiae TaxID=3075527 RepID=A0ABU2Q9D7_9ACTN|nr:MULTISPECIES: hypothetical protein [unclassified Streptomyces]MDT0401063.1 hypothetical protein [Streptomyces sp. DSM 41635]